MGKIFEFLKAADEVLTRTFSTSPEDIARQRRRQQAIEAETRLATVEQVTEPENRTRTKPVEAIPPAEPTNITPKVEPTEAQPQRYPIYYRPPRLSRGGGPRISNKMPRLR